MGDLFPTPTRLKLLRGVGRGEVTGYPGIGGYPTDYFQDPGGRNVTARVTELFRFGWVGVGHDTGGASFRVRLTDAGRKVLEEADRRG